jgi:hypothetical protein
VDYYNSNNISNDHDYIYNSDINMDDNEDVGNVYMNNKGTIDYNSFDSNPHYFSNIDDPK